MKFNKLLRTIGIGLSLAACALLLIFSTALQADSDPWTKDQTVQPADLAKELENSKTAPTVIYVGFQRLYSAGHIKGAVYHGTSQQSRRPERIHFLGLRSPAHHQPGHLLRLLPDGALPQHPPRLQNPPGSRLQKNPRPPPTQRFCNRLGRQRPPLRQSQLAACVSMFTRRRVDFTNAPQTCHLTNPTTECHPEARLPRAHSAICAFCDHTVIPKPAPFAG